MEIFTNRFRQEMRNGSLHHRLISQYQGSVTCVHIGKKLLKFRIFWYIRRAQNIRLLPQFFSHGMYCEDALYQTDLHSFEVFDAIKFWCLI